MAGSEKLYEAEFLQLVIGLHGSAWMLLGKVANPMTGKVERNLDAAKATIDTLAMLKAKTQGNLSKDEEDYLSNILQQLQLNYVDEAGKSVEESVSGEETKERVEPLGKQPSEKKSPPKEKKRKSGQEKVKKKKSKK
jgi:hypothetical protein